jgi:hypothetical protein
MPQDPLQLGLLALGIFLGAGLYSAGGHAGATAYLAVMALFGVPPAQMKPTALAMNILVAVASTVRFTRAGAVPWRLLRWLCLGSVPASFLGGRMKLSPGVYFALLGGLLLVAAVRLWLPDPRTPRPAAPAPPLLVGIGVVLGFVSGLTGIGGGIFLTPLLILTGWAEPRQAGGAAIVFILVNSVLGLLGNLSSVSAIPHEVALLAPAALAGGLIGSYLGVHKLVPQQLRRVNAVVLLLSGLKLLKEGLG